MAILGGNEGDFRKRNHTFVEVRVTVFVCLLFASKTGLDPEFWFPPMSGYDSPN